MQKFFAIASLSLVILLTSTNLVASQIVVPGNCPDITTEPNFNLTAYSGKWYVYSKYTATFVNGSRCLEALYTPTLVDEYSVLITQLNEANELKSLSGSASLVSNGEFIFVIQGPVGFVYEYSVLGTDYSSFATVFSCNQSQDEHTRLAWILSREPQPSAAVVAQAEAVFVAQGIDTLPLVKENQQNC